MRIGITGVTGLIGRRVAALARERGHEVIGFSRRTGRPLPDCTEVRLFTADSLPDLSGCDAVLNLAGESVAGLWTAAKRKAIRDSRVLGTRRVVQAFVETSPPPRVLVNGSAVGFYGDTGESPTDEQGASGSNFLAKVCRDWEGEARRAGESGARVVLLRTGIVLARESGALAAMLPIFRLGLGGKLGGGRQFMSWIHLEDEAALALWALENEAAAGPLNATAPTPVRNAEFTRILAGTLHRPAFLAVPAFALRLLTGGFSAELLQSRRILPGAAAAGGFPFRFPTLAAALDDLLPPR